MAPPPPATPTPHRFLVPKRSQPRGETPTGQQFQATPRFAPHSTPRAGPSSSAATPFRSRPAGRDILIESSSPPLPRAGYVRDNDPADYGDAGSGKGHEQPNFGHERGFEIDVDDVVQESSPLRAAESSSEDSDEDGEKRAKRIRVSSPPGSIDIEEAFSLAESEFELDAEVRDTVPDVESSLTEASISEDDMNSDEPVPGDDIGVSHSRHRKKWSLRADQPTFQKAPRFKPAQTPEGAQRPEPLPDAFSPRRKGARYIQGGLAAELRDWLVDIEAGAGSGLTTDLDAKRHEERVMKIRVESLHSVNRSTRDMTLVLGRHVLGRDNHSTSDNGSQDEGEDAVEVLGSGTVNLILAGPGRLSGLGIGNDVRPGVLLGIARPTWEVVLDGLGRFGVACDWVVLQ